MEPTISTLRLAEHEALRRLVIDGEILDVGGNRNAAYPALIGGKHNFTFANIDPTYGDMHLDAEKPWPVASESYDCVLMSNLLEHLYDYRTALNEAYRVLKPGGRIVMTTPFMFYVHGSPSDYFRYTSFALERMLADAGFAEPRIESLGTGAFSVMFQPIAGPLRWPPLVGLGRALAGGVDGLLAKIKPRNMLSAHYYPLGYYSEAVKGG